jgi:hypothetical protein
MSKKALYLFFFLFPLLNFHPLNGEVESVTISWNTVMCNPKCAQLIEKRFKELKEIAEVNVNPGNGVAKLKWKPDSQFSYITVKRVMQMVGAGVNDIHVRVRGKVRAEGKKIVLYSLGDNTRFQLVSPIQPEISRPVVPPNPALMELTPTLREKILEDADQDKIMVIEGPLYRPWNTPFLVVIVERLQVEKKQQPETIKVQSRRQRSE